MQEKQVTVDGKTHELPLPFMVCATQNPVELAGTYPLPEAQLDRFLIRISMGYPSKDDEVSILEKNRINSSSSEIKPIATAEDIFELYRIVNSVKCTHGILTYIVDLAGYTRTHEDISLGASPRASIALVRSSMGLALMRGRDYVIPDDVQYMLKPVFAHRLVLNPHAHVRNQTVENVLKSAISCSG